MSIITETCQNAKIINDVLDLGLYIGIYADFLVNGQTYYQPGGVTPEGYLKLGTKELNLELSLLKLVLNHSKPIYCMIIILHRMV